ncbi:MAG: hypothetical protein Q9227_007144 [Pyrenula ochraceoflavens]
MPEYSKACCTVPPVIASGYNPKGKYTKLDGLDTYTTGPSTAKDAILVIYDIFGFKDQILQGADILAHSDSERQYQVFMPDFFEGSPADISWYPPDNDEKGAKLGAFFQNQAAPPKTLQRIPKILDEAAKANPAIKSWGIIGYCWGGKITSLISGQGTPFKAAVETSPAMVDPADAEKVTIPLMMLASKDEPAEDVQKFEANLKVKKHVETFGDQLHGFMSARGDLNDAGVKKEYERGYMRALSFFHEHM